MDILLNNGLLHARYDSQTYKLKEFLTNFDTHKYKLPLIVNLVSLNNYGRSIKNILIKNTPLLLLEFDQLDSVIADYYGDQDSRPLSQRTRLILPHSKTTLKPPTKIRHMKKLSRSVASLSVADQTGLPTDDGYLDDEDENAYNRRGFIKLLNEKRSSAVSLCRIPSDYQSFFELLNANDKPIEAYTKLGDLPQIACDLNDTQKRIEKNPFTIFLRSSCNAYMKKSIQECVRSPATHQNSTLTVGVDSCYGSSSDLDSQKNSIVLNEHPDVLQAGQTLVILDSCSAIRTPLAENEIKQLKSPRPSSPHFSPAHWMRSRFFSLKKTRQSNIGEILSHEVFHRQSHLEICERYAKCRTQQGDIVYISFDEPGLFSPLNCDTHDSKSKTRLHFIDTSDVFQLRDLLSNFRFPITVRLLDGAISFDNIYAPAVIDRHDTSHLTLTKFRLLGSHNERVVFACPLNKAALRASKTSLPCIVLPLSVNADIEIQPCINMNDISRNESFHKLLVACSQVIKQQQTEITLVHFPLSLTMDSNQVKQALQKRRSHSACAQESFEEEEEEEFEDEFSPSRDQLDNRPRRHSDEVSFLTANSSHNRNSNETIEQKSFLNTSQQQIINRHSPSHIKTKDERKNRFSHSTDYTSEDQIFEDVDKIYDFIRSGYPTEDIKKIQDKERQYHADVHTSSSTTKTSEQLLAATCPSPGKMVTHRFTPVIDDAHLPFYPCEDDGNVNSEQAHALYLASKQRKKDDSPKQDVSNSKAITKMRRITRH